MWDLGEYQKCGIWASTRNVGSGRVPEMWDPGEYREGNIRVSTGKGKIRASIGEGKIRVSTGKGRIQASTGNVEIRASVGKGRIRVSTGKVEIRASTGSGRNPGEMLENLKQAKRSKQTQGKVVGPSMTSRVYQQMTRISQKSNTIMTKEGGMSPYDNRKCHK